MGEGGSRPEVARPNAAGARSEAPLVPSGSGRYIYTLNAQEILYIHRMPDTFYSFLLLSSRNFNKTGKSCGRNRNWTRLFFDKLIEEYGVSKKVVR